MLVYYARANRFFYVVMVAFVMVSSVMVSYTRARAESLVQSCKAGFMERPERIVLVILGALFNRMGPVLWVIAVLSTITVIHRIRYSYQQLSLIEPRPTQVRRSRRLGDRHTAAFGAPSDLPQYGQTT